MLSDKMTQNELTLDIQPKYLSLDDLFYGRLFRIPQYQRNYSWQKKQREDLFDDILFTWNNGKTKPHFMSTVVGLQREKRTIATKEHQVIEIVDGQQRITTLIILLKAISNVLDQSELVQDKIRVELEHLLVKDDEATLLLLQTNHDSSHYFVNYLKTGLHPKSETASTLADKELLSCMEDCEGFVTNWMAKDDSLYELVSLLKNRLTFVFHEIRDESVVYSVFEVLNSRGLEVPWFDRLKSIFMAMVFESNSGNKNELIDVVHQLWTSIYAIVGKRIGMSSESLRFAATLSAEECPSRPINDESATDYFRKLSEGNPAKVIDNSLWIKTVTEALDKLISNRRINAVTKISQARLLATAINLRVDFTEDEKDRLLQRWEKVTFRIYGMFGKDARTLVGDYVRLAWRIKNENLSLEAVIKELTKIGNDYPIEEAVKELKQTDCYNGWEDEVRYFSYRYEEYLARKRGQVFNNEQWNRIWQETASKSIEHIYSQSRSDADWIHWIGNLMVLPPRLNSSLGNLLPKEKIEEYKHTGLLSVLEVADKISKGKWDKNEIEKREEQLLEWALREWSD